LIRVGLSTPDIGRGRIKYSEAVDYRIPSSFYWRLDGNFSISLRLSCNSIIFILGRNSSIDLRFELGCLGCRGIAEILRYESCLKEKD
jgi:hypothetical protein